MKAITLMYLMIMTIIIKPLKKNVQLIYYYHPHFNPYSIFNAEAISKKQSKPSVVHVL
jgi:hypothetical protein